jgi:hypothetical protein
VTRFAIDALALLDIVANDAQVNSVHEDVAAREIAAGDVLRLDDPQAQRVWRAVHVDGRVVRELRPVGLEIWETVRPQSCRRTGW